MELVIRVSVARNAKVLIKCFLILFNALKTNKEKIPTIRYIQQHFFFSGPGFDPIFLPPVPLPVAVPMAMVATEVNKS